MTLVFVIHLSLLTRLIPYRHGATYEYGGSVCAKEITSTLATKFGIPASNIGKKVYPHFNLESNSTNDANYCQLAIWNTDGTTKTTQEKTEGNILHPALPLDPAEAHQYAIYCSLKTLTEEEKLNIRAWFLMYMTYMMRMVRHVLLMINLVRVVHCGCLSIRLFQSSICRVINL